MSSLHVAHLVCGDGFAGVEGYTATLAAGLAERDLRVTVVGGRESSMRAALAGTSVRWLAGSGMSQAFRALMATKDLDLVNAHMTQAELVAVMASRLRRFSVLSTRHFGRLRGSSGLARVAGDVVDRRLVTQIAISGFVASRIGSASEVVHSGVASIDDVVLSADREPAVLVAQRLEREKHTAIALRSWGLSHASANGWRLWIAGAGQQEADLKRLAIELGVNDSVDFLGHRSDVQDLYRRASILLAPTPLEGLGLSVVEAMAAALPIVATAAGGHIETAGAVEGSTMFSPGDAEEAASMLDDLVADPDRRDVYGQRLRTRQRTYFTLERQVSETIEIYERVAGR